MAFVTVVTIAAATLIAVVASALAWLPEVAAALVLALAALAWVVHAVTFVAANPGLADTVARLGKPSGSGCGGRRTRADVPDAGRVTTAP